MFAADIDERHGVQRVRRVRSAIGIDSIVAVAVVSDDDNLVVVLECGIHHLVHAYIYRLYGFHDSVVHACVSYHVAVGEVERDIVVLLRVEGLAQRFGNLGRGHLRLQVVGRYLR